MKCPSCRNKGFAKTEDISRPHVVFKTDRYDATIMRYRMCLQCGHRWITQETYARDVKVPGGLFPEQ